MKGKLAIQYAQNLPANDKFRSEHKINKVKHHKREEKNDWMKKKKEKKRKEEVPRTFGRYI